MRDFSSAYFKSFLNNDEGIRLLRSRNAYLVLSFLYAEFRANHIPFVTSDDLETHLVIFLQNHLIDADFLLEDNADDENESVNSSEKESSITDIQVKAHNLVSFWCSDEKSYIRRYYNAEKTPIVELNASVERLFTYLENSEPSDFVGTESRFQDILFQLRNLSENANQDPKEKIKTLLKEKKRIESEIKKIKETGVTKTFTSLQIKERLTNVRKNSSELLSDFRQIEDNFHSILKEITREQTESNSTRGVILGYTLDTNARLRKSPQGQSFTSFWNFISQDSDNEINKLIENISDSLNKNGIPFSDTLLRNLKQYLYQAGHKIIEQNRILTDRINRVLATKEQDEHQQIKKLTSEIKQTLNLLIKNDKLNSEKITMYIEGKADLFFPQARYAVLPSSDTVFTKMRAFNNDIQNPIVLKDLFNQFYIDEKLLLKNAELFRKKMNGKQFTLSELVKDFPIKKGLAEIVAWYGIAEHNERITVIEDKSEIIEYQKDNEKIRITVPRMIFL